MFGFYLGLPHIHVHVQFAHLACQTAPSHYIAKLANPHLSGDPIAVHFCGREVDVVGGADIHICTE